MDTGFGDREMSLHTGKIPMRCKLTSEFFKRKIYYESANIQNRRLILLLMCALAKIDVHFSKCKVRGNLGESKIDYQSRALGLVFCWLPRKETVIRNIRMNLASFS